MRIYSKEEWAKLEAEGRGRYLFRKGVIGRGVPMGLVVALLIELWDPAAEELDLEAAVEEEEEE